MRRLYNSREDLGFAFFGNWSSINLVTIVMGGLRVEQSMIKRSGWVSLEIYLYSTGSRLECFILKI